MLTPGGNTLAAFLLLIVLGAGRVMAQDQAITGVVTETDGTPLPGVTVALKGTSRGANTDATGNYRILAPATGTLVFSFVGKTPQEAPLGGKTVVNITLADDSKSLQEVVVTGYGTQRRKDLTGSIAAISSDEFQKGNIVAPEQLIAGKLAGVSITPPSGQPGGGSQIRIRGGSSLNASNDPLVVIDNVPVDNTNVSGAANALSLINPNDIETFTVLKDASAAAIYGARAANGVILITTKRGASGAPRISFNTLGSVSVITKKLSVFSGDAYRALINDTSPEANFATADQRKLLGTASTDWQDQIYHAGISSDNNLSVSGSMNNIPYRVSYGYTTQNGILKTSNFQRNSIALNLSPKFLNNNLRVDISAKGSIINNRFADQGAIGSAAAFDPTRPVFSGVDNFGGFFEWLDPATGRPNALAPRNPLGLLYNKEDRSQVNRFIGNVQLDYKMPFLTGLRANLNLALDASSSKGTIVVPAYAAAGFARGYNRPGITGDLGTTGGTNNQYSQTRTNKTLEFYLNYAKDIKSINSRVDVTGGYSYQDFIRDEPSYADNLYDGRQLNPAGIPFNTQYTLLAFFGRANYTFNERYTLTATIRRDGTSRFGPDNRWGWFPSVGAAWSIKDEAFLKNSTTISALKLRFGYGVTGQQDLSGTGASNYAYLPRYTISDPTAQYQFGNTFYPTLRAEGYDANLKWEQTESLNAAIDYALFNGRISGSVDFYDKKTKDLLAVIPVAAGSNLTNQILTNVGNLQNRGVEFTINTTPVQKEDLKLEVGFNVTYNQNKITNLSKVPDPTNIGVLVGGISGGTGNTIQVQTVGYPTNTFFVNQQVYGANGRPLEGVYVDRTVDGTINVNDRYRYQTANPKLFLGFTSQLTAGRFSGGFVMRGNFGNYVYNNLRAGSGTYQSLVNSFGYLANGSTNILDTRFRSQQLFSDYYVENAAFVRMDNLNLGYNFGRVFGGRSNLRASATVQNVFVITKYTGPDPEIANGIDSNFYPRPRTFSVGLNLDL